MTLNIILDCDGVLADFIGGALKAHGRTETENDIKEWEFWKAWGITEQECWEKIKGRDFWLNLEPYPWAHGLLADLQNLGDVTISTMATRDAECGPAKIEWIQSHFGIPIADIVVTAKKHHLARPGTVLIDDNQDNVDSFVEAGGNALLFDRPWNRGGGNVNWVIGSIVEMQVFGKTDLTMNPKDSIGSKKLPVSCVPANVIGEISLGLLEGSLKYGRHNYRSIGIRASVYYDACWRHLAAWWEGEDIDKGSGLHHITKLLSSAVVLRDAMMVDNWHDDRPPKLPDGWVDEMNAQAEATIDKYPDPKKPWTEL